MPPAKHILLLLLLLAPVGCKHTPGGGPLRHEWMDFWKKDRSWLIHSYDDPHRYGYRATTWSPMLPGECDGWFPALGAELGIARELGPNGEVIEPGEPVAEPEATPLPPPPPALDPLPPPGTPENSIPSPDATEAPPLPESDDIFMDPVTPALGSGLDPQPAGTAMRFRVIPASFVMDEPAHLTVTGHSEQLSGPSVCDPAKF